MSAPRSPSVGLFCVRGAQKGGMAKSPGWGQMSRIVGKSLLLLRRLDIITVHWRFAPSLPRSFAVKLKLRQKCGALPQSWLCSAAAKDYGGGGRLRSVANHDEARRRGRRCLSAHLKQPRQPSSHLPPPPPPPPQPKHPYSLRLLTRERKNERARERTSHHRRSRF